MDPMKLYVDFMLAHWPHSMYVGVAILVVLFAWMIVDGIRDVLENREEIACAAIKYDDIGVLALPAPARHHHVMWARLFIDGTETHGNGQQGFLTTHGRFVDRKLGLKIATKRGQIEHKHGNLAELYSEDMWPITPSAARGYSITHIDDEG